MLSVCMKLNVHAHYYRITLSLCIHKNQRYDYYPLHKRIGTNMIHSFTKRNQQDQLY